MPATRNSDKFTYTGIDLTLIFMSLALTAVSLREYLVSENSGGYGAVFFGVCSGILLAAPLLRGPVGNHEVVEFDEVRVRRIRKSGNTEQIEWSELAEIGIVTTDEGPDVCDCYWLLLNADRSNGCAIPNDTQGFENLLVRFQKLPEFDNDMVVRALGSTSNDRFLVWKKDGQST